MNYSIGSKHLVINVTRDRDSTPKFMDSRIPLEDAILFQTAEVLAAAPSFCPYSKEESKQPGYLFKLGEEKYPYGMNWKTTHPTMSHTAANSLEPYIEKEEFDHLIEEEKKRLCSLPDWVMVYAVHSSMQSDKRQLQTMLAQETTHPTDGASMNQQIERLTVAIAFIEAKAQEHGYECRDIGTHDFERRRLVLPE